VIDLEKLRPILDGYRAYFPTHWEDEEYKWQAVSHFRKHWQPDAEDFGGMFEKATELTFNLLASGYAYPRAMILNFAQRDDRTVRRMFEELFDETRDLPQRIEAFQSEAEALRVRYNDGGWKHHYQNTNAISTYLWLMYPDQYYIYRYEIYRDMAQELSADYRPRRNGLAESVVGGFRMYDEICEVLQREEEIKSLLFDAIAAASPDCYPDRSLHTLAMDIGFYVNRFYLPAKRGQQEEDGWFPADYTPGLTVDEWAELLQDSSVFTRSALQIVKRMKDYGGQATCKQLSVRYGENPNFYNGGSWALARRIAEKTECPLMEEDGENMRYWPVLYVGKKTEKRDDGTFIWRLRRELSRALDQADLSQVPLYVDESPSIWKISHGKDATGIPEKNRIIFESRSVAVVHSKTKAKAFSKVTQGQYFMDAIRKGDYFYLCYGSRIRLLGQFTGSRAVPNPEMRNGWYEREYRLIAKAALDRPYTGLQKWWTPNDNSTCIRVDEKELFEKLILTPYFHMTLPELFGEKPKSCGYWWLTANPRIWSFSDMKVGEEQGYTLYNDNGNKRRIFQNFLDARAGDAVVAYESNPVGKLVAIGKISQESDGKSIYFEKIEGLTEPIPLASLKKRPELEHMEFFAQPNGSLFRLTREEYDCIMDMIREDNPKRNADLTVPDYTDEHFLSKVFMTKERFKVLKALLQYKKNVILQGAPGVGKTFTARRLAYAMMGKRDDTRIAMVQFHQNYSYEDFVMGYRPDGAGFRLTEGSFCRFCGIAANDPGNDYFFLIDEINRGNISKIFGELLMLIEKDYRNERITPAYGQRPFFVPDNLYLIGMMNTADRSLAMIDYALRRRFSFFEIEPGFHSEGFQKYQSDFGSETFDALIDQIKLLNREIADSRALGPGFRIGHSYFCGRKPGECTDEWMRSVVEFDILPTLSEYWFDEPETLQRWEKNLRGVFDDE